MKRSYHLCVILFLQLLIGCHSNDLSRDKALALIKKEFPYPTVKGYYLFLGDPATTPKVTAASLDTSYYTIVVRKVPFSHENLIVLTDKSKPFLLPVEEKERADLINRVRTADEDIISVTGIKMLADGKKAIVDYTTQYKNLTPFSVLDKSLIAGKDNDQKAYFSLYDDGWRLEKKPGLDFMGE